MKKTISLLTKIILLFGLLIVSCQNNKINNATVQNKLQSSPIQLSTIVFDSTLIGSFFKRDIYVIIPLMDPV
jgi:hypothetical protein